MKKGFTLVEIMIVVSLVIILVAFAVPNMLRSRIIANEGVALGNLRAINNACQLYHLSQERYPESLFTLISTTPPYIDSTLASGEKQGYRFNYNLVNNDQFTVNANPMATGLLKGRHFYLNESGIIRVNSTGPAGPDDPVVGQGV